MGVKKLRKHSGFVFFFFFFHTLKTGHLQQLKEMQSSKLGM